MGRGEGDFKGFFAFFGNFHEGKRLVHVVFGDQSRAVLPGDLPFEAVGVVQIAVMRDGDSFVSFNFFVGFRLCGFESAQHVERDPAVSPEFSAQDVFVEVIGGFGKLNCQIDATQRFIKCRFTFAQAGAEFLQREDFFFHFFRIILVNLNVDDGLKERNACGDAIVFGHAEKMRQPRSGMPVLKAE